MKKKLVVTILITSVFFQIFSCAFSEVIVINNKQEWYDLGIVYKNLSKYADALDAFTNASGYMQSDYWAYYCNGMLYIIQADEAEAKKNNTEASEFIDQALSFFKILSNNNFEDSANLVTYCQARKYEILGLTQKALDIYETLADTYDSGIRYLKLRNGSYNPFNKTGNNTAEELPIVNACAYKETNLYSGPGFSYQKEKMTINSASKLWIVGEYGDWYLIEFISDDMKLRAWAQAFRIGREEDKAPSVFIGKKEKKVISKTTARFGPGEDYPSKNISIPANTIVNEIARDKGYALIEFKQNNNLTTGWISTDCLK